MGMLKIIVGAVGGTGVAGVLAVEAGVLCSGVAVGAGVLLAGTGFCGSWVLSMNRPPLIR
jgi:hypothetical protein